jgi:hypothetical protein
MKVYRLSEQEVAEVRIAHRAIHRVRDAYRLNSVILFGSGWTPPAVAESLLTSEQLSGVGWPPASAPFYVRRSAGAVGRSAVE